MTIRHRICLIANVLATIGLGGCAGIPAPVEQVDSWQPVVIPPVPPKHALPPDEVTAASNSEVTILPVAQVGIESKAPESSASLASLVQMASENNPTIKQAMADVAAARGAAVQAGLHPNPVAGYQGDQILAGNTLGQQGGFFSQVIVTRGKLALAQAAALANVAMTEAALQQAQADLAASVRARYYLLVTAKESVRISQQMSDTAEALAQRQKKLLESGQAVAPHEVSQARALAATALGNVIQARNRVIAAEKQLAATVGVPILGEVVTEPARRPLPEYGFDELKSQLFAHHTDLQSAVAQVERSRFEVELARVTPYPNINTNTYVQHDFQAQTPQFGVQLGVAIPVFNRNQGNLATAEAQLVKASHEADRVRLDLTARLAEAFERYTSNRKILEQYNTTILPEQLKAFEGLSKRFEQEAGKVSFTEVVLTQQTLANTYSAYIKVLGEAWQAVADLTRLVQNGESYPASKDATDSWKSR